MKQKGLKYIGLLWIAVIVGLLQSYAQPLSFETRLPYMDGNVLLRQVTETEDNGFILMFTDQIIKLNSKGERVWRRFSNSIPNPYKQNSNYNPHYGDFIYKRDTTYIRGFAHNSSYYAMLNGEGRVLFDTTYFVSWRYPEDPFASLGLLDMVGDDFISIATVFTNLRFDSVTFQQSYDNRCLLYQKVNKHTGARRDVKTICLSDSNQNIMDFTKLRTSDRGYLVNVFLTVPWQSTTINHNLMIRLDSAGNLIEVNDMFPREHFPNQGYQRIEEYNPIYDPEMYDEKYYPLRYTFDSLAIGAWVRASVGKERTLVKEYLLFYDTFGRLVNWREIEEKKERKSKIQIFYETVTFYGNNGSVLWEKIYPRGDEFTGLVATLFTSNDGLFMIRRTPSINDRRTFLVQHIGPHGYDFGYDPDAPVPLPWNESDSLHVWFNVSGGLSVPLAMAGWEMKVLSSLGQEFYSGQVSDSGELPLPPKLSAGVYIIFIRSPETGKHYHRKLFKE
jgi:hypothetical protein